ncbi:hypothetical protein MW887_010742 [Aspergillus wentii]|nr:hypothetical protein MW887_010742 [Aspergillus wentii]
MQIKALIFGLGNVLCFWSPPSNINIPPNILKCIMSSDIWFDYERGKYTREECYAKIAERFTIKVDDMASTMTQARQSLRIDGDMMSLIKQIKQEHKGLKVHGMTNTPSGEEEIIHAIAREWPVFDHTYISGTVGMRKPDTCFYKYVLEDIGLSGQEGMAIFVDDSPENILSARSFGIRSILFTGYEQVHRQLLNILGDPIERGYDFLTANAKNMYSLTETGEVIRDNFAQLLILELTDNMDLVDFQPGERVWNYFIGKPVHTTESFPNDLDTTSIALSILPKNNSLIHSIMDEMLTLTNPDGISLTYFDPSRLRIDPVVCVNILTLFCKHNRHHQVLPTFHWVLSILRHRAYLDGTRYYPSPDAFLYFLTRLVSVLNNKALRSELLPLLKMRVNERIGAVGDATSLAMRVHACKSLGIGNERDMEALKKAQLVDGGWPAGCIYQFGSSGLKIGNRGLSTAFAVRAIQTPVDNSDDVGWRTILIFLVLGLGVMWFCHGLGYLC